MQYKKWAYVIITVIVFGLVTVAFDNRDKHYQQFPLVVDTSHPPIIVDMNGQSLK